MNKILFSYIEGDELHGLFKFYQNQLTTYFSITASSTLEDRGSVQNVIDYSIDSTTNENTWISQDIENSSFTIEFLRTSFNLKSYSIQSRVDNIYNFPCEWSIEGSYDNNTWRLIDYHERNAELHPQGDKVIHWYCDDESEQYFKYFKMKHIGHSCVESNEEPSNYYFSMNKIEFFGNMRFSCTYIQKQYSIHSLSVLCYILIKP